MSWSENHKADDGFYHMDTADWDPEAFTILLNMLHLRFRQVSRSLSLELLAKVAMLVDYYQCWEAFDLIADVWANNAQMYQIKSTYDRDLMLWMLVSWVFKLDTVFHSTTGIALRLNNRAKIQDMGLTIPPAVLRTSCVIMICSPSANSSRSFRVSTHRDDFADHRSLSQVD